MLEESQERFRPRPHVERENVKAGIVGSNARPGSSTMSSSTIYMISGAKDRLATFFSPISAPSGVEEPVLQEIICYTQMEHMHLRVKVNFCKKLSVTFMSMSGYNAV